MENKQLYFKVDSKDESEKIQRRLFELGFRWRASLNNPLQTVNNDKVFNWIVIELPSKAIYYKEGPEVPRRGLRGDLSTLFTSDHYANDFSPKRNPGGHILDGHIISSW